MKKTLLIALCLLFASCTKMGPKPGQTSEEVVRNFIELSGKAKAPSDKKKLKAFCVGEMEQTFERMSDEAFRLYYLGNNLNIKGVKLLKTKSEGESSKISYEITVENRQGTDPTDETNQREVELKRIDGAWFIHSIRPKGSDKIAFTRGMVF